MVKAAFYISTSEAEERIELSASAMRALYEALVVFYKHDQDQAHLNAVEMRIKKTTVEVGFLTLTP